MMQDLSQLESAVGYVFKKHELMYTALTHTSYANEHGCSHNQRMEFLGDSVLSLVVSRYLYDNFSHMKEGDLSKLRASVVCEATLAELAQKIKLTSYMRLGVGERNSGGENKASIQADCFESIIAAIYLDSDLDTVSDILLNKLNMQAIIESHARTYKRIDYKTALQEVAARKGAIVKYTIYDSIGPDHDKTFFASATVELKDCFITEKGQGRSKKDAEQDAAGKLLNNQIFNS